MMAVELFHPKSFRKEDHTMVEIQAGGAGALDSYKGPRTLNYAGFVMRLDEFRNSEAREILQLLNIANHYIVVLRDPILNTELVFGPLGWAVKQGNAAPVQHPVRRVADEFSRLWGYYPNREVADVLIKYLQEHFDSWRRHRIRVLTSVPLAHAV